MHDQRSAAFLQTSAPHALRPCTVSTVARSSASLEAQVDMAVGKEDISRQTYGSIAEIEIEQVFILDLRHLNDGLVLHALRMSLHLGPHQLIPLV